MTVVSAFGQGRDTASGGTKVVLECVPDPQADEDVAGAARTFQAQHCLAALLIGRRAEDLADVLFEDVPHGRKHVTAGPD